MKNLRKIFLVLSAISITFGAAGCSSDCTEFGEEYRYDLIQDNSDRVLGKFSWDMRIDKPISKQQLEVNARIIQCEHPGYDRYFITYYLPNYQINAGAWATAHFDPNLKVEILALQK